MHVWYGICSTHHPSSVCVMGSWRNSFENSGVKHAFPRLSFILPHIITITITININITILQIITCAFAP